MDRILVADGEGDLLDMVEQHLTLAGFRVDRASTGRLALEFAERGAPDLVVLDVELPGLSGLEVLRVLRESPRTRATPVILLSASQDEAEVLVGFELGADDYVGKPLNLRAFVARVRAVLRRSRREEPPKSRHSFGDLEVDVEAHRVLRKGLEVPLPPQEFRLLGFLATHPNRVYTRDQLITQAWQGDAPVDPRTVDAHIGRLRSRIETDPARPRRIETVRGAGYRFNPAPETES